MALKLCATLVVIINASPSILVRGKNDVVISSRGDMLDSSDSRSSRLMRNKNKTPVSESDNMKIRSGSDSGGKHKGALMRRNRNLVATYEVPQDMTGVEENDVPEEMPAVENPETPLSEYDLESENERAAESGAEEQQQQENPGEVFDPEKEPDIAPEDKEEAEEEEEYEEEKEKEEEEEQQQERADETENEGESSLRENKVSEEILAVGNPDIVPEDREEAEEEDEYEEAEDGDGADETDNADKSSLHEGDEISGDADETMAPMTDQGMLRKDESDKALSERRRRRPTEEARRRRRSRPSVPACRRRDTDICG